MSDQPRPIDPDLDDNPRIPTHLSREDVCRMLRDERRRFAEEKTENRRLRRESSARAERIAELEAKFQSCIEFSDRQVAENAKLREALEARTAIVPCMMDISRPEDMGRGSLLLFKQEDGDWIIRIIGRNLADDLVTCSIEFCTPMMGGGSSPKTWEALEVLAQAMMEDDSSPRLFGLRAEHQALAGKEES